MKVSVPLSHFSSNATQLRTVFASLGFVMVKMTVLMVLMSREFAKRNLVHQEDWLVRMACASRMHGTVMVKTIVAMEVTNQLGNASRRMSPVRHTIINAKMVFFDLINYSSHQNTKPMCMHASRFPAAYCSLLTALCSLLTA